MGVVLQGQHGWCQRADPRVLLPAWFPPQLQQHPPGSDLKISSLYYHTEIETQANILTLMIIVVPAIVPRSSSFYLLLITVVLSYIDTSVGCMDDGTALGDVQLPPWAKGDPQEFIRIHREVSDPWPHQASLLPMASLYGYIQAFPPEGLIMLATTRVFRESPLYVF